jgi:peptide chain release factor 2
MKEYVQKLTALKEKIASTWTLLDVDGTIAKMHGLEKEMQASDFWNNQDNAKAVSQKHEEFRKEVDTWTKMKEEVDELLLLSEDLTKNPDEEMKAGVVKRVGEIEVEFEKLEFFLLLSEEHDKKNAIVAIHAGSGGTDAQDWAGMIQRMLFRYAEKKNWTIEVIDESKGQEAGIKSLVFRVQGRYAYGHLKSEHGTHRLVRISPFDAEKMRHTSFALAEVIPEIEHDDELDLDMKDVRVDTFMSGGKGGQSVNTTYSAVRLVHIPTGTTVQCQNERSQLQNKETALRVLKSKLQKLKEQEQAAELKDLRGEYKSAEWGNQIRSYVLHPYKMIKDVRSKYESQDVEDVLDGNLEEVVEAYLRWKKEQKV